MDSETDQKDQDCAFQITHKTTFLTLQWLSIISQIIYIYSYSQAFKKF